MTPVAPPRPCTFPGCPTLVGSGRCVDHQPRRASASERGYGAAWRRKRAAHLRREPLCRECAGENRVTEATDVDHIISRARGGSEDDSNLQSLCHSHHSRKTAREDGGGWETLR